MFIQTQDTPNPNALKFFLEMDVSKEPVFFNSKNEALGKSSLAVKIFEINGVSAVFFGSDFITVTKKEDGIWNELKSEILMVIMDHLSSGFSVIDSLNIKSDKYQYSSEIEKQIIEIIDTRVRPSVAMDGGDIVYRGFKDGVVLLELKGACSGCPSSSITLKNGIETMLQHFVPEVKSVSSINE